MDQQHDECVAPDNTTLRIRVGGTRPLVLKSVHSMELLYAGQLSLGTCTLKVSTDGSLRPIIFQQHLLVLFRTSFNAWRKDEGSLEVGDLR